MPRISAEDWHLIWQTLTALWEKEHKTWTNEEIENEEPDSIAVILSKYPDPQNRKKA